jgi:succinate dehydrogenase / fumarate reductase flavoprotein subunit
MITDALNRRESCGAHFREEYQTPDGVALRNDEEFAHVAVWEYAGENKEPLFHREKLVFEETEMKIRSYK